MNPWDAAPLARSKRSRREFLARVARQERLACQDHTYIWTMFERSTGDLVGVLDVHILTRGRLQVANLGYRIDNRYWRRGFAREMLKAMIPILLRDLRLQRLEAVIDPDNRPSIRLVRGLGLKREGLRRNYWFQNGRWDDQVVFVATRQSVGLPTLRLV
jgi:RimJ/RimL family protein N-acetyltransferase